MYVFRSTYVYICVYKYIYIYVCVCVCVYSLETIPALATKASAALAFTRYCQY